MVINFLKIITNLQKYIHLMQKQKYYDHLAKILMIGNSGVGKTNILLRYCQNTFNTAHMTTIGIDFKIKTISIDDKRIRLQIWDTAGQERFKTVTQAYYKGCMGIFLIYSVTDLRSFQAIDNWVSQAKTYSNQNVSMMLIGNKSDIDTLQPQTKSSEENSLPKRQVTFQQGQKLAQKYSLNFMEVSAKTNHNIEQMFLDIAKEIKESIFDGDSQMYGKKYPKGSKISISEDDKEYLKKKKKCC